ncbi:ESX secretion-associated protein EspG [Amycolatopsis sacchari]|uniref:EspG family protein n=1 Tax=Amycolatopsis sacchari TaxID=115433 RepID=A0A1I4CA72_9PSEU|nr:ESX secretion-associated protein EspG [Amycolatopsis sacchari]SFK77693.1 EspG family protein [Amycolatopsis sacchari]
MSDAPGFPTVFELVDEVIRPVTRAVPRRPSVLRYYDPEGDPELPMGPPAAGVVEEAERQTRWHAALGALGLSREGELTPDALALFRVLRRGPVRGAVTAVFADRLVPLRMHFFGDREACAVLEYSGARVALNTGPAGELPARVAARLPRCPAGPGEIVRIAADPLGRVSAEQAAEVARLRALAARPRTGTAVFDLTIGSRILAEHPRGAVVLFDTDLGRYLLITALLPEGDWVLYLAPATRQHVAHWIGHSVLAHLEAACG